MSPIKAFIVDDELQSRNFLNKMLQEYFPEISVTGQASTVEEALQGWLVKLDRKGNIQWDKTLGGSADEYCHGLSQTADSSYIIGGSSVSGASGEKTEYSRGGADYWAIKLGKDRNVQWDKTIGGNGDDGCNAVIQTKAGGYMLLGGSLSDSASGDKTESSRGKGDYWVVNLNHKGQLFWEKTIGGYADDWGIVVAEPIKNKFVIGGSSNSPAGADKTEFNRGDNDYWIIQLNYQKPLVTIAAGTENVYRQLAQKSLDDKAFTIYPNPFSNSTNISFSLYQIQKVSIQIFDMNGKLIKTLTDAQMQAGTHQLTWNAKDEKGNAVSAGIYFLRMQTGMYVETKKISVIK